MGQVRRSRASDSKPAARGRCNLVLLAWLLTSAIAGCRTTTAAPSPFQTNADHYEAAQVVESMGGAITNASPERIEVAPANIYTVYYRESRQGWRRLFPHWTSYGLDWSSYDQASPSYSQPLLIEPDQTAQVNSQIARVYRFDLLEGAEFLIGASYRVLAEGEGEEDDAARSGMVEVCCLLYSNEFRVGDPYDSQPWIQATQVVTSPRSLTITNNHFLHSVWIRPFCSLPDAGERFGLRQPSRPSMFTVATLERRTAWGSWEVIRPDYSSCQQVAEPVEIPAQATRTVEPWQGAQFDWTALEPGMYRWHVVYFWDRPQAEHIGLEYRWFSFGYDYHDFGVEFWIDD